MTQLATTTKPAPAAARKPTKEEVRQMVLTDQAAALKDAASRAPAKANHNAKPAKTAKVKAAKPAKAQNAKAGLRRKITVLAKSNPHAAGSRRAGWFKQLKRNDGG